MLADRVRMGSISGLSGTPVSELNIGSKVKDLSWVWEYYVDLREIELGNVTWIVVAKNHPSYPANSVTLISEEVIHVGPYDTSTNRGSGTGNNHWGDNGHPNSSLGVRKFLNGSSYTGGDLNTASNYFYDSFSDTLKNNVLTTKLPNKTADNKQYFTQDKVFIPSETELGGDGANTVPIGNRIRYFNNRNRHSNGVSSLLTRSPHGSGFQFLRAVERRDGSFMYSGVLRSKTLGYRPMINVSADLVVLEEPVADGTYILST